MNPFAVKIAVIGRDGQVAWELRRSMAAAGPTVALGRPQIDLADPDSIRDVLRSLEPDVVINAAAYTAVDQAEAEPDLAMRINAEAPGVIAEEAKRRDALFLHYSSDYVFDGTKSSPYIESDDARPLGAYGASKLAGDRAVEAAGGAYLILRTSWVYGARGKNFLRTMMHLLADRDEVKVVDDQTGAPTWSRDIAGGSLEVVARLLAQAPAGARLRASEALAGRRGIYNMTSGGSVSWCGFAQAIREEMIRREAGGRLARIVPIASREYRAAAARPGNSRLSNEKLRGAFGVELPHWRASLQRTMDEIEVPRERETAPGGKTGLRS